jgi:hypothetical protein
MAKEMTHIRSQIKDIKSSILIEIRPSFLQHPDRNQTG